MTSDPNPSGGGEAGGCVAVIFTALVIACVLLAVLKCHFGF